MLFILPFSQERTVPAILCDVPICPMSQYSYSRKALVGLWGNDACPSPSRIPGGTAVCLDWILMPSTSPKAKKIGGIFLQALVQYSCLLIKTNSAEKHCKSSGKELTFFYDAVVYWEISRIWNMPCSTIQRKTAVPPCSGVLRGSKLSAHRKQIFHLSWKVLLMLILQTVTERLQVPWAGSYRKCQGVAEKSSPEGLRGRLVL